MGHGQALFALALKLYLVLLLTQAALAATGTTTGRKSQSNTSSSPSSSSLGQQSHFRNDSSPSHTSMPSPSSTAVLNSTSLPRPSDTTHNSMSMPNDSSISTSSFTSDTSSIDIPTSSSAFADPPNRTPPSTSDDSPGPTPSNFAPVASPSATAAAFASTKSNHEVPIIASVVGAAVLIIVGLIGFCLRKRQRRARDRREWERTHEAIADAVRQVGSPDPMRAISPYGGSDAWSHLNLSKGSGDTVTDPFVDHPVAHQSAEYSGRPAPVFRAVHSPTFRAAHSPTFAPTYAPFHAQQGSESHSVSSMHQTAESHSANSAESGSIPVDTSYDSHGHTV
ncbi:hypothetical protein B0H13DRAFT_2030918 [Mycena leptocephala]|nr:hypothetical protein B0H13DRAFT_2030918 [Mycena leptocephala]